MSRRQIIIVAILASCVALAILRVTGAEAASAHPVRDTATLVAPGAIVTCDSLPGLYGDSWRDDAGVHIRLSRPSCSGLLRLAAHTIRDWSNSANALETLIHERDHWPANTPDGEQDEGVVDCRALASMPFWLARLGYHGAERRRLMRAAWSIHDQLPSQYLGACTSPFDSAVPIVRP